MPCPATCLQSQTVWGMLVNCGAQQPGSCLEGSTCAWPSSPPVALVLLAQHCGGCRCWPGLVVTQQAASSCPVMQLWVPGAEKEEARQAAESRGKTTPPSGLHAGACKACRALIS